MSWDPGPDDLLLDRLERSRNGANTHLISNLRNAYLGSIMLVRLGGGDVGGAEDDRELLLRAQRRIEMFLRDCEYRTARG